MNFRDEILEMVCKSLSELMIIPPPDEREANPDCPGTFYPVKFDVALEEARNLGASGEPEKVASIRAPNDGYFTPTWQTVIRPLLPQDVIQQHLAPSVFINVRSGQRSASGRGRGRQNVSAIGVLGEMTEDYGIDIQGVFCNGVGAAQDPTADPASTAWKAKPLSQQINGFIHDLDILLNATTLRMMLSRTDIEIVDAYIMDWQAMQAFEGKPDEVVVARLNVTVNFARVPGYEFQETTP